ncbi:unnamed protein product, partial [Rotaria magnacalcarata]
LEIEERIRNALEYLDQDLHGEYRSLKDISDVDQIDLREKSVLFQKPAYHPAINAIADDQWPTG